jgi:hypothetical protein
LALETKAVSSKPEAAVEVLTPESKSSLSVKVVPSTAE